MKPAAFLLGAAAVVLPTSVHAKNLPGVLDYAPKTAGQTKPLQGSAKALADAQYRLRRGEPKATLRALGTRNDPLFEDRLELLRGDALLALSRTKEAIRAYHRALKTAQVESVAILAARGLVAAYGKADDRQLQLKYVDALLAIRRIARRPNLLEERARLLVSLRRYDEAAKTAWQLLADYPSSTTRRTAHELLKRLKRLGIKVPVSTTRWELARIRNLVRSRAFKSAERALKAFEKNNPGLRKKAWALRAEMYRRAGKRRDEQRTLERLHRAGLEAEDGPAVLYRLGRIAMSNDDDAAATRYFDELRRRFPTAKETEEGLYLAGWLAYNDGRNAEGTRRLLAFADDFAKSSKRTEALWFAGWSAYEGGFLDRAQVGWKRLIAEHPDSTLVSHAQYWLGRILQKKGQRAEAIAAYLEVVENVPLTYYGFWAATRLDELGKPVKFATPPAGVEQASVEQAFARLGPKRPINLDRAVILYRANLESEAHEELEEAERALKRVRDTRGQTLIADLLDGLGAHYLAFRTGMRIAYRLNPMNQDTPWAWRAWRHAYPLAFNKEVKRAASAHGMDNALILAIMRTESHFRPHVKSPAGARGLMQLMPGTARQIGKRAPGGRRHAARYRQADSNVWLGTWYLKSLLRRYKKQLPAAVGAYNAGPGAMDRWLEEFGGRPLDEFVERLPYRETRRYTRRVLETLMVYRRLYGGEMPELLAEVEKNRVPSDAVAF